MKLQNRVAAVTGGTAGIGRGIAEAFLAEGARVALMARDPEKAARVLNELGAGDRCIFVAGDVTQRTDIDRFISQTTEQLGAIDILVNNAGGANTLGPIAELSDETFDEVMKWNLYSTFWASRAAVTNMLEGGFGRIINIASLEAKVGRATFSAYTAAKHAVVGLTKSMAQEVGTDGVTVNAICPGLIITDVIKANGPAIAAAQGISYEESLQMFVKDSAIKRPNTVEEVGALAVLLASEAGAGITGQALSVDGGTSPY